MPNWIGHSKNAPQIKKRRCEYGCSNFFSHCRPEARDSAHSAVEHDLSLSETSQTRGCSGARGAQVALEEIRVQLIALLSRERLQSESETLIKRFCILNPELMPTDRREFDLQNPVVVPRVILVLAEGRTQLGPFQNSNQFFSQDSHTVADLATTDRRSCHKHLLKECKRRMNRTANFHREI